MSVSTIKTMGSKRKNKEAWAPTGFEEWGGYMAAKKAKLEEQFQERAAVEFQNNSNIFKGICIFVNGYTRPSADDLRLLMMEHQGVYHHYLRPRVTTHVIASNLPYSKIVMHKKSQNPLPICKPEWITESIEAGKLLNYEDYLLYSQHTKTQPKLTFAVRETAVRASDSSTSNNAALSCTENQTKVNRESEHLKSNAYLNEFSSPGTSKGFNDSSNPIVINTKLASVSKNLKFNDDLNNVSASGTSKDFDESLESMTHDLKLATESINLSRNQDLNEFSAPGTSKTVTERLESSIAPEAASPIKECGNRSTNSTKNPEFLSEFYNNSRLHHISTMAAMFKDYINELRDKSDKTFPGLESLKKVKKSKTSTKCLDQFDSDSDEEILSSPNTEMKKEPVIMHIDMDCFFVSVGIRNRPELKGLPVAVTHAKGNKPPQNTSRATEVNMYKERLRGKLNKLNKTGEKIEEPIYKIGDDFENSSLAEIASCSYEARKAGIKNGMFLGQALKLCPNLKMIRYDFEGYTEVSHILYDTVATYTLDIEAVSCDEMYADCTKIIHETGLKPLEFAEIIRKQISEKTGCPVSTGFGKNKLQARLATRKAKPNGQFYLESKDVQRYMSTINIRDLPGVGFTTNHRLNQMGAHTCAELQSVSLRELQKELGKKTGETVYNLCRGIDNSKLSLEHVRKSVSAEVNYGIRFQSPTDAEEFLKKLSEEVCNRLDKANVKGRSVTLKLMIRSKDAPLETAKYMGHGICDHFTKSKNLISSVNNLSIITKEVLNLWNQLQQKPEDVRGVGIQISRLESTKKSGNSNLLSFIGKAKIPDNKPKSTSTEITVKETTSTSTEVTVKETKSGGLDGFLIAREFPPDSNAIGNSTSCNTPKKRSGSDLNRTEELRSNRTGNSIKLATPSPGKDFKQLFDKGEAASSSRGKSGPDNLENPLIMEDIDESVLAALPEDIRNEIIKATKKTDNTRVKEIKKPDKQEKPPLIQKKQDSYFKESKKNIERPKKSEMPPLQEIDLAVLLELPDDIRNEILNDYRTRANESKQQETPTKNDPVRSESPFDVANLSISQVDPEVLAALPKDIQNDVKSYCASKKLENKTKLDQMNKKEKVVTKQFGASTSKLTSNQKSVKQTKAKVTNVKISKTTKSKKNILVTSTKSLRQSPEPDQQLDEDDDHVSPRKIAKNIEAAEMKSIENKIRENVTENIKSLSMAAKSGDPEDQKTVLKLLVEELMSLPLKEVKLQIQNWISESDSVNEVDFLAFTTFLSSLPKKKRIEDLHILLKTMHRCIETTGRCVWHRAYRKTVEHVQRHMLATYDSSLMVPLLKCSHSDCKKR